MSLRKTGLTAFVAAASIVGLLSGTTGATATLTPTPTTQGGSAFTAPTQSVPTPEEFFGYPMGEEAKLPRFHEVKAYLSQIADSSPLVNYEVVGETTEGEEFPIVQIGSAANLDRLEEILDINARLADPAQLQVEADAAGMTRDEYARTLAADSVPVYYIEAGIHSTEVGNTPALMNVVHRFATERSDFTEKVLDAMVIVVVPSQNPDGHNRVVDYFMDTEGTDYDRVFPDLYQKYVGHDNNRDWFMFTQEESRIRLALEQKYRPVVQHYMHQAGANSPRIWSPPWDEPMSPVLDPITVSSANSIGQEANRDLIAAGKKGAKTDDAYGIMWNADVMGYSTFQGTTTWLTEIASARDLWFTYTSENILEPSAATLRSPLPYDETTWRPMQIVEYAETAVYSGLETVAGNPQEWLYRNMYQVNANSETWDGGASAYVIPAEQRDPFATYELLSIFDLGAVVIEQATEDFTAGGTAYEEGSWILRTDQPMGRWVDQLLRIDEYPDEARKCNDCPLIMPYSETTDNLGLLMGVDVDAVNEPVQVSSVVVDEVTPAAQPFPKDPGRTGAYVVGPTSYGLGRVITALEQTDVPVYRAAEEVDVRSGTVLPPGALIVPARADGAREALEQASADLGLPVYAVRKAPRVPAVELEETTRVGLVRGANNMPGGWLMWMLEQYGTDYAVVSADDYEDLAAKYDTIVLAPGISTSRITDGLNPANYPEEFHWARGVPDGPAKLAEFVEGGGNLVALGSASTTAVDALSLPADNIAPRDRDVMSAPGALLQQTFDPTAPAAWGMPEAWPVWYGNDPAFAVGGEAQVAASYPESEDLLVSGYAHGTSAIAGASNVATFEVGDGQATIAGGHITFRTWPRATWTVVTNAIYNGAGTPLTADELALRFR